MKIRKVNSKKADEVLAALKENNWYCPCALEQTRNTRCPCKEFIEQQQPGECNCGFLEKYIDSLEKICNNIETKKPMEENIHMDNSDIATRMKRYESVSKQLLTRRMPLIIRLDGKAFHTLTRNFARPDLIFALTMWNTAKYLCEEIQGCKLAYVQSDEISLLLTDYDGLGTHAWFDKEVMKMTSVSASMATLAFNNALVKISERYFDILKGKESKYLTESISSEIDVDKYLGDLPRYIVYLNAVGTALFDSRAFVIPKEDVCNYFIWRQQDATRNAIQMFGQKYFSAKELHKKSCNNIQEMLWQEKQINFNDLDAFIKRGACLIKKYYYADEDNENTDTRLRSKWEVDIAIPIFTQDRDYINQHVFLEEF